MQIFGFALIFRRILSTMNTFSLSRQAEWQLSSPVYQHNNLTWLSLGKWVMSRALQFAVPTASLKERAVSFRDLAAFSFGLCPFLLGSAFYRVALMFLLFHSVFAFLNILSSWILPITYWIPSSYSGLCWLLRVLINYIKIEFCLYITVFLLFFFPSGISGIKELLHLDSNLKKS